MFLSKTIFLKRRPKKSSETEQLIDINLVFLFFSRRTKQVRTKGVQLILYSLKFNKEGIIVKIKKFARALFRCSGFEHLKRNVTGTGRAAEQIWWVVINTYLKSHGTSWRLIRRQRWRRSAASLHQIISIFVWQRNRIVLLLLITNKTPHKSVLLKVFCIAWPHYWLRFVEYFPTKYESHHYFLGSSHKKMTPRFA